MSSKQGPSIIIEPCGCKVDHGIPQRCAQHSPRPDAPAERKGVQAKLADDTNNVPRGQGGDGLPAERPDGCDCGGNPMPCPVHGCCTYCGAPPDLHERLAAAEREIERLTVLLKGERDRVDRVRTDEKTLERDLAAARERAEGLEKLWKSEERGHEEDHRSLKAAMERAEKAEASLERLRRTAS